MIRHKPRPATHAGAALLLAGGLLIAGNPLALANGPAAHGHHTQGGGQHGAGHHGAAAFGVPGDATKPSRLVEIVLSDAEGKMTVQPGSIAAKAGEQLLFRIRNEGVLEHEFILATAEANLKHAEQMRQNQAMAHNEPNMQRLLPNETKEVLWRFTEAGTFQIGCLIPGHLEAGMEASVVVTRAKSIAK